MKTFVYATLAALSLTGQPATGASPSHGHGHAHDHGAVTLRLDHGRKWPTDEALRRHMDALRADLSARRGEIRAGRLPAADYAALGGAIERRVAGIVEQCKLPPEADAMLHLVVADLVASADVMQGKARGRAPEAARRAVAALDAYGRHFDHPGWEQLR